ncbi:hypothetical protein EXIGLDRAFT_773013 [Exidia glandulosa HHB12029]|uniref:DUF6534 domain-containing protein n=1 Tax=Exidia glandulosa HHB12029 TaxID=1314781 RepID=A0A165F106_EXIGL|nr:hypothetical protein EXIGLDRAFT_773013 [Exidia glandulosa HHB12029]
MSLSPAEELDIFDLLRAVLADAFLNSVIIVVQTVFYVRGCTARDSKTLRCLVAFVVCGDLLHTALLTRAFHSSTIVRFFDPVTKMLWSQPTAIVVVGGLTVFVIRTHWSLVRVRRLTSSSVVALGCWAAVFVTAALEASLALTQHRRPTWLLENTPTYHNRVLEMLFLNMLADVSISSSICYYLYVSRHLVFVQNTNAVDKLFAFTIGSGFATSCASCLIMLKYLTGIPNTSCIVFYAMLPKIVTISFLSSLNGRVHFREDTQGELPLEDISGYEHEPLRVVLTEDVGAVSESSATVA